MGKRIGRILLPMLSLLVVLTASAAPAAAAPYASGALNTAKPMIYLDPASAARAVGTEFDLVVRIQDVNKLLGAQYRITFNPSVLQVVDADPGRNGVQIGGAEIFTNGMSFVATNTVNNATGAIEYSVQWVRSSPSDRPPSGSGVLGRIHVRVVGLGNSALQFVDLDEWTEIYVEWPDGSPGPISATWTPATVNAITGYHLRLPLVANSWQ